MEKGVSELLVTGNVLLFGDFSARTGQLPDYLLKYKGDDFVVSVGEDSYQSLSKMN